MRQPVVRVSRTASRRKKTPVSANGIIRLHSKNGIWADVQPVPGEPGAYAVVTSETRLRYTKGPRGYIGFGDEADLLLCGVVTGYKSKAQGIMIGEATMRAPSLNALRIAFRRATVDTTWLRR